MATITTLTTRSTTDLMEQLTDWIKNPPETSRVVMITPKAAATILGVGTDTPGMNSHNRGRKPGKIREYANDMVNSQWHLTGDTIKFTKGGLLGDGQNRLYACVRSRKSFLTHIVFGIDDAVFPWLDKGRQRSIGDDFFVDGMDNPQLLAHMMRWLELFRLDQVKERTTFSRAEIRDAYFNQGYNHELLSLAMDKGLTVQKATNTPRSLASALYYLFATKNRELADEFFDAWSNGTHAGRMNPISKANRVFVKIVRENPLIRIHDTMRAAVWVLAWNFVVRNKKGRIHDFEWSNVRPFPKIAG